MTAGLPGAGIGGLFFVLSAFFMLVVEIQRTVRGRSSRERWALVLRNVAIAASMIVAVTAVVWVVHRLAYPPSSSRGGAGDKDSDGAVHELIPFSPVLIALGVLAVVLVGAYLLRFVAGRRRTG